MKSLTGNCKHEPREWHNVGYMDSLWCFDCISYIRTFARVKDELAMNILCLNSPQKCYFDLRFQWLAQTVCGERCWHLFYWCLLRWVRYAFKFLDTFILCLFDVYLWYTPVNRRTCRNSVAFQRSNSHNDLHCRNLFEEILTAPNSL